MLIEFAVPLGEELVLNSLENGGQRLLREYGDWTGGMGVRVATAEVYPSFDDALAARDLGTVTGVGEICAEAGGKLLVVDVELRNVDAVGSLASDLDMYR